VGIRREKNKKLITRWEYQNVTWPVLSHLFTYLRLSIDIHWTGSSNIKHRVNLIQQGFELERNFAQYVHYTDVRIADLYWAPYVPSTG